LSIVRSSPETLRTVAPGRPLATGSMLGANRMGTPFRVADDLTPGMSHSDVALNCGTVRETWLDE
jgi:hypothetical protein